MNELRELSEDKALDLVRAGWYAHDARWFNAVAEEFGMETANRLNQRAVTAMSLAEARRLGKAVGQERCSTLPEFLDFVRAAAEVYVPSTMIDMEARQIDERSYEVVINRCFVAENIARAGIADSYGCAVFHRVAGWHDAMGLPLEEEVPPLPCALANGQECRRTMTIRSAPFTAARSKIHFTCARTR